MILGESNIYYANMLQVSHTTLNMRSVPKTQQCVVIITNDVYDHFNVEVYLIKPNMRRYMVGSSTLLYDTVLYYNKVESIP